MNPRLNRQLVVIVTLLSFLLASLGPMPCAYAGGMAPLPVVGSRISLSAAFTPAQLRGITVDPKNPLRFEFLIERGQQSLIGEAQQDE